MQKQSVLQVSGKNKDRSERICVRILGVPSHTARTAYECSSTGVEHEFMVQSRGGHFSIVTATLEHSKKYLFQAHVAVAISD